MSPQLFLDLKTKYEQESEKACYKELGAPVASRMTVDQMGKSGLASMGRLYRELEHKHRMEQSTGIHRCAKDGSDLGAEAIFNIMQHLIKEKIFPL